MVFLIIALACLVALNPDSRSAATALEEAAVRPSSCEGCGAQCNLEFRSIFTYPPGLAAASRSVPFPSTSQFGDNADQGGAHHNGIEQHEMVLSAGQLVCG